MNAENTGNPGGIGQKDFSVSQNRTWFDGIVQWRGAQSISTLVLAVSLAVSAQIWQKQQEMVRDNLEAQVRNELDDVTHVLELGMGCTLEKGISSREIPTNSSNVGKFIVSHVPATIFNQIHVRIFDGNQQVFDSQSGRENIGTSAIQIQKPVPIGKHTWIFEASPTPFLEAQYTGGNFFQKVVYSGLPMSLAFSASLFTFIRIRRQSLERVAQLLYISHTDDLTGLPNRRYIQDSLPKILEQAQSGGMEVGFMIIDIVGFEVINDSLGQDVGDELLKQVARRMTEVFSEYQDIVVGRQGGDEFILILSHQDVSSELRKMIEKLQSSLRSDAFYVNEQRNHITVRVSIGTSVYTGDEVSSASALIAQASLAMNTAKDLGGGICQEFSPEMEERVGRRQWIDEHLRGAIGAGEIKVVYQPIVDSDSKEIISMEVLSRWNHEGENIPPDEFIPVAESNGCIVPMGYQVIQDTCRQIMKWKKQGIAVPKVFINLSVRQLQDPSFEQTFLEILGGEGISEKDIGLEVTESMLSQESVKKVVGSLTNKGFEFAIDDFGTGFSNIGSLLGMRISKIKIDKSFVKSRDKRVIGLIVLFAREVGAKIVVEGVETLEEAEWLQGLGCHSMQGFLFSRPQTPEQMQESLTKNRP